MLYGLGEPKRASLSFIWVLSRKVNNNCAISQTEIIKLSYSSMLSYCSTLRMSFVTGQVNRRKQQQQNQTGSVLDPVVLNRSDSVLHCNCLLSHTKVRERSGSVVECLTRDRGASGSSLTGVTALWSLSKTHLSLLSTGSTQEVPSRITERLLSGRKESNQTNKTQRFECYFCIFIFLSVLSCVTVISKCQLISWPDPERGWGLGSGPPSIIKL